MFGTHMLSLVWHTGWTPFFLRLIGRFLSRFLSTFQKHSILLLFLSKLLALYFFHRYCLSQIFIASHLFFFYPIRAFSVASLFVINLFFPLCSLRPVFQLSSFTVLNWCFICLTPSVVRPTSLANLRFNWVSPSTFIPFSSSWAFIKDSWIVSVNNLRESGSPFLTPLSIGIFSKTWLSICTLAVAPV